MDKLKALIEVRDKHFLEHTQKILKEIYTTLTCVSTFLTDKDEILAQGTILWEDVTFMEDMLIVMGTIEYKVGDVLTFADTEYPITEQNVADFQQIVHYSLPYDLVLEGNVEKIMEHINAVGMGMPIEEFSEIVTPVHSNPDSEFDLSDLTDEQRKNLSILPTTSGH